MTDQVTKRKEQTQNQRRRRDTGAMSGVRYRLGVDEALLDRNKFEYRFVNDVDGRVEDLTQRDDWEVVQDRDGEIKTDGTGAGSEVAVRVGGGMRSVLLRKPKEYYDADFAAAQRRIDEKEAGIRGGAVPGGDNNGTYVPGGKGSPMEISRK